MATVALTVGDIHSHATPHGYTTGSAAGKQVLTCLVELTAVAGTYASADDGTASAVGAAIAASRRDGRTVTLLRVAMAAPGAKADGTVIGTKNGATYLDGVNSDDIVQQLTQADLATEHADGALNDTFSVPITLAVTYEH